MEQNSNPYDLLIWPILGVVAILVGGLAYNYFRVPINTAIMAINNVELSVITLLPWTDEASVVLRKLHRASPVTLSFPTWWPRPVMSAHIFVGRLL